MVEPKIKWDGLRKEEKPHAQKVLNDTVGILKIDKFLCAHLYLIAKHTVFLI